MTPAISSLLWFLAILAAIPLLLWAVKRSPLGRLHGLAAHGPGAMRTVSTLALSPSQRLVTVEVGEGAQRRWLVLGVTPASIQTVHVLDVSAVPSAEAAPTTPAGAGALPFSHWLDRMRQPARAASDTGRVAHEPAGGDPSGRGHG